MAEIKKV